MTAQSQTRLHYLDAMRSVLMLLGVVLHAARPYNTSEWRIKDPASLPQLDSMVWAVHLFRMPAFFVIAGFFAMFLVVRRPTGVFLHERLRRVVVPLVAMMLTVNVLQAWVIARFVHHDGAPLLTGVLLSELASGGMASHLWFLACLALYFCITAAMAPLLRRLSKLDATWSQGTVRVAVLGVLAAGIAMTIAIEVVNKLSHGMLQVSLLGLVKAGVVLDYLPYFLVGLALGGLPRVYEGFARLSSDVPVAALASALGLAFLDREGGLVHKLGYLMSYTLLGWAVIRLLFVAFARFASAPSPVFRYLSSASYSVYLFHHLLVIVLALLLIPVELPVFVKFLMVLTGASFVSLLIHHFVIRPSTLMTFLFNGALPPAPPLVVPPQVPAGSLAGDSAVS